MAVPTYATRDDVVDAASGVARLVQIADHDNDGVEDEGLVDRFICKAEALANTYIRRVREVPLPAPVPQVIIDTVAGMTVFMLKAIRPGGITPQDELLQEHRIAWLEGVASGKIDLGVNPAPPKSPRNSPRNTKRPSAKAVSRDNLKGFA